jgi:hypothetical protein
MSVALFPEADKTVFAEFVREHATGLLAVYAV